MRISIAALIFVTTSLALAAPSLAQTPLPERDAGAPAAAPPICCGETCSPGRRCCAGTVCGSEGRCVPDSCAACGDRGCRVDYAACTGECAPPVCCGETCGPGRPCCDGTACGSNGRCVPEVCRDCGDRGCMVDYRTCSATCATPECCSDVCVDDDDCCGGTVCRTSTAGGLDRRCVPPECDQCQGMTSICVVDDQCGATCMAPPGCGESCVTSATCGANLVCREFASTGRRCVPEGFDEACEACGRYGCAFTPASCSLTCAPAGATEVIPPRPRR